MRRVFRFETNCVNSTCKLITDMVEQEKPVGRATFLKHVDRDELREIEAGLSYEQHPSRGLTMAGDWHVSYHKSHYDGKPCYYFRHSAIEWIFVESEVPQ